MSWSTATSKDRMKGVGLKADSALTQVVTNLPERIVKDLRPELAFD